MCNRVTVCWPPLLQLLSPPQCPRPCPTPQQLAQRRSFDFASPGFRVACYAVCTRLFLYTKPTWLHLLVCLGISVSSPKGDFCLLDCASMWPIHLQSSPSYPPYPCYTICL